MTRKKALPKVESTKTCYCYLRVSSKRQGETGLSIGAQEKACMRMAKQLRLSVGVPFHDIEERNGLFVDIDQSAWRKEFDKRPGGKKLLETVVPGDTIIVAKIDRAFRSMADFCDTSAAWAAAGIRLVLCNPQLDLGSANGRAMAHVLAAIAEWESSRKSERICAALKVKKQRALLGEAVEKIGGREEVVQMDSDWRPVIKDQQVPLDKPGTVHYYIRCSHRDSAESGLGLFDQIDHIRDYSQTLVDFNSELKIGKLYTDPVVSASSCPMRKRTAGKALLENVQEGDHIVFAALDRGFRDMNDLTSEMARLANIGVTLHFVNEGLSTSSDEGRLFIQLSGIFAENEARMASERAIEARSELTSRGRYAGGWLPTFWTLYKTKMGTKTIKRLVVLEKKVESFELVQRLIKEEGLTITKACQRCEEIYAERENRPVIPPGGCAPLSNISKKLPRGYPRDDAGWAHPLWIYKSYTTARTHYARARAALDKRQKVKEELREQYGPLKPLPPVKYTWKGYQVGQNPPNELRGVLKEFDLEEEEGEQITF